MKKIIILSVAAIAITLGACNNSSNKTEQTNAANETTAFQALDTATLTPGAVYYQCEMHREVTSAKEGSCPKCGMTLVKVVKQ